MIGETLVPKTNGFMPVWRGIKLSIRARLEGSKTDWLAIDAREAIVPHAAFVRLARTKIGCDGIRWKADLPSISEGYRFFGFLIVA